MRIGGSLSAPLRENSNLIMHQRVGRGFRSERYALDRFRAQHRRQGKKGVYVA